MAPFTPYMVLVTHVVTKRAISDLEVLTAVNAVLKPVTDTSPFARHVFETCEKLYRFAEATARRCSEANLVQTSITMPGAHQDVFADSGSETLFAQESCTSAEGSDPTMALIDWQMMPSDLDVDNMLEHV